MLECTQSAGGRAAAGTGPPARGRSGGRPDRRAALIRERPPRCTGGIAGSLLSDRLKRRFHAGPVMAVSTLVTGLALLATGLWPDVWVAMVTNALISASIVAWNVLVMSLRQAIVPIRLFGRVQGTWRTLLWGVMPLGSVLGGIIGRIDLALPFVVGGSLTTLLAVLAFGFYRSLPDPEDVVSAEAVGEPV